MSGKSISQYCYEHGYYKSALYNWRSRYEEQAEGSTGKFIEIRATTDSIIPEVKLWYPNGVILEIYGQKDEISSKPKPGKLYRKNTIRRKYKKANSDQILIAEPLVEPIVRCEADVSLLAHITVSKFVDHLPEYRQQQIFKREGVVIPPSTMNGWIHQLEPHIALMAKHIKAKILESQYIQQDESTIRVMDGKRQSTHLGYMWVMSSPEQKYVCFEYMRGRGREGPMKTYAGYTGDLQTDAYEVYDIIDKAYEQINHFYCWAHACRKFIEAQTNDKIRSEHAIHEIQKLYAIEKICREQNFSYDQ